MRHRLVLTYEALAADVDAEAIMVRVLSTVPAPVIQPTQISGPTDAYYQASHDTRAWG
jgi:MoxR-like ATPase